METKFRRMLMEHSGEERLKMGCSMHATARALVIASISKKNLVTVNRALFLRFYGDEFEPKARKRILRALREAAKTHGRPPRVHAAFKPAKAAKEMHVAEPSEHYRAEKVPVWLRRLQIVKAEMKSVRFPRSAQEGFRQCGELSDTARRLFWESIRADHPEASDEEIEKERRLLLARFSAAEVRWLAKWKKERDRYFRG
jgi:hypothetical protein